MDDPTPDKRLILRVYLLDDRYHGEGDLLPAPARLFQALVAGSAIGAHLPDDCAAALRWLERDAGAPLIRAQRGRLGLAHKTFVPNNDLDAKAGDPGASVTSVSQSRSSAAHRWPDPHRHGWCFRADNTAIAHARTIVRMADDLDQLGRGVDMAFASADLYDDAQGEALLQRVAGEVFRPSASGSGIAKSSADSGSLASLQQRYAAQRGRFSRVRDGRKMSVDSTNARKARFGRSLTIPALSGGSTSCGRTAQARLFVDGPRQTRWQWSTHCNHAAYRLTGALPDAAQLIQQIIIGRGVGKHDKARRTQIIPIPIHRLRAKRTGRFVGSWSAFLLPPDPLRAISIGPAPGSRS